MNCTDPLFASLSYCSAPPDPTRCHDEQWTWVNCVDNTFPNDPYIYQAWAYDQLGGVKLSDFDSLQMLPYEQRDDQ